MEQKETNASTTFSRALEHFSGPLLAVWILIPSLQAGLVADDYRVISTAGGLKPHTTIADLSHDSSSEPHYQPAQPLSDRVEHFLRKVVNSITYDLRHGSHGGPHYRPVEPLSYRVDSFLWKGSLWGYHLTNILAHALSAWLVSRIAFSLFGSWQVAAIAGSLFALHPAAASAIAWITGRNAGFVCLFLLFSTWFLLRFQATNNRFFLVLSIGTFGIALLTKEQAWVFPVFLLALLLSHSDSVTFSRRLDPKIIIISSFALFMMALLLVPYGDEILRIFSTSQNERLVNATITASEITLACFGFFLLSLGFAMRVRPSARVLIWFLFVEALVIFIGFLPSKILAKETFFTNPFSFSFQQLSTDLFVLLSTIGIVDFTLRDALNVLASKHPWLIGSFWVSCGGFLLATVIGKRHRARAFAGLVALLIGLAPMRAISANFFELSNTYVAVPVVAITMALILKWIAYRSRYLAAFFGISLAVFWASNLRIAQVHLSEMGRFSDALYSILKHESRDKPGPLRVIVNVPDPFRIAQDEGMVHFSVFRVAQAAMHLGGYRGGYDENMSFVEHRVVQVLAVEHGASCRYEARVLDQEKIFVTSNSMGEHQSRCLSQLRFIDFTAQVNEEGAAIIAHRRSQYSGIPLTESEVYLFDGNALEKQKGVRPSQTPK